MAFEQNIPCMETCSMLVTVRVGSNAAIRSQRGKEASQTYLTPENRPVFQLSYYDLCKERYQHSAKCNASRQINMWISDFQELARLQRGLGFIRNKVLEGCWDAC